MTRQHYFFKLIPPRPTFAQDMNDEERNLMQQHARYAQERFAEGKILLYGPVMAEDGAFGLGILEVENEDEARSLAQNDPTVKAGLNRFEIWPMGVAAARALTAPTP